MTFTHCVGPEGKHDRNPILANKHLATLLSYSHLTGLHNQQVRNDGSDLADKLPGASFRSQLAAGWGTYLRADTSMKHYWQLRRL